MQVKRSVSRAVEPESRYLATDLVADRDMPPFDRVAMDGIAIAYASYAAGNRSFLIEGIQFAGSERMALRSRNACIEVMTGAVLPTGCDTVIRYEDIKKADSLATLTPGLELKETQNVHKRGSDRRIGELLVARGSQLLSPQWAVAATIGAAEVDIVSAPSLSIIATGDEIVDVGKIPLEHQIRGSNTAAMMAALRQRGFDDIRTNLVSDDPEQLVLALETALTQSRVCILTGAVSMGLHDHVPRTLKELGVREVFHKIRQRPGKPLWFGKTNSGTLVFGLPGNPVSALISLYRYVIPTLYQLQGVKPAHHAKFARLTEAIHFSLGDRMTLFAPVRINYGMDGVVYAQPVRGVGSGDLAALADTDGFVECFEGRTEFPEGSVLPLQTWGIL
jgi:molybdopterin molybdotransferase